MRVLSSLSAQRDEPRGAQVPTVKILEYVHGEVKYGTETEVPDFQAATKIVVEDLWSTSSVDYATDVLTKWFGGQHFADSSPDNEKSFDVRQYDGPPGMWTDFLYRA